MGENIGATARVMWNFGVDKLRLISPRDGWPNQKAVTVSSGGGQVLDKCSVHSTVEQSIEDLKFVFATTIRTRKYSKDIYRPDEGMRLAKDLIKKGKPVGILFGSERAGLESKEIAVANAIISIPVNSKFKSLNLSHAAGLLAYEWFKISKDKTITTESNNVNLDVATQSEVTSLINLLKTNLKKSGYFWPEDKSESLSRNIENLFHRLPLTSPDVRTFFGILKAIEKNKNKLKS